MCSQMSSPLLRQRYVRNWELCFPIKSIHYIQWQHYYALYLFLPGMRWDNINVLSFFLLSSRKLTSLLKSFFVVVVLTGSLILPMPMGFFVCQVNHSILEAAVGPEKEKCHGQKLTWPGFLPWMTCSTKCLARMLFLITSGNITRLFTYLSIWSCTVGAALSYSFDQFYFLAGTATKSTIHSS